MWFIWFATRCVPHSVSRAPRHQLVQPSLRAVRPQFILPCSNPLFRVPTLSFPFEPLRTQTTPAGVSSLIATSPKRSHLTQRLPAFATFRPQVFSTSRRFLPHLGLQAYCIPLPRQGFNLFKGFSLRAAISPHRKHLAPMPLANRRSLTEISCHIGCLDFEALIRLEMRSNVAEVSRSTGRSLPQVRRSSRFSVSLPQVSVYPRPSARAVSCWSSLARWPTPIYFSVLSARSPACLFPDCRPARAFEPSALVA